MVSNSGFKEVGDYFASTQQIKEALPFYLRVLELQPDEPPISAKQCYRICLNQSTDARRWKRSKEIIKEHPEKYQTYELLAQLHDDSRERGPARLIIVQLG